MWKRRSPFLLCLLLSGFKRVTLKWNPAPPVKHESSVPVLAIVGAIGIFGVFAFLDRTALAAPLAGAAHAQHRLPRPHAHSKGVTASICVTAHSKGVAGGQFRPKPGKTRCLLVTAHSKGLTPTDRRQSR